MVALENFISDDGDGPRERHNNHLITVTKGNGELCFPETLNVSRGESEGNIEGRASAVTAATDNELERHNKRLKTGTKGNNEFCFPETLNVLI